jgi:hypothetical protein
VVTLFLLTVLGLLLGVSIKNRMLKAGLDSGTAWSASRRWWEVRAFPFQFESFTQVTMSGMVTT